MRLGQYQTLGELRRSGAASLWKAEGVDGGGGETELAAKVLLPAHHWSDDERAARAARFLARASVQKSVAGPGSHWAPVHDLGEHEGGAYYVTDHYPASADQLIRKPKRKGDVDGAALYRIVRGVVAGLIELKKKAGRAHGRLTPANVLLTSAQAGGASVALTDPAAAPPRDGEAADCRAVGELIYALVLRREFKPGDPVKKVHAWRALGPPRDAWRKLCARLLDPAEPLESLEGMRDAVEACKPPIVTGKRVGWAAVLAGIAAGAFVLFGGYRVAKHVTYVKDWAALCEVSKSDWLQTFVERANEGGGKDLDAIIAGAPDKKAALEGFKGLTEVRPKVLAGDTKATLEELKKHPPAGLLGSDAKITSIMQGVRALQELCRPDKEPVASAMGLEAAYKDRSGSLGNVLGYDAQQIARMHPRMLDGTLQGDAELASPLAELMRYRRWVEPLRKLDPLRKRIVASRDADLVGIYDTFLKDRISVSVDPTPENLDGVERLVTISGRIVEAMKELDADGDVVRFREQRPLARLKDAAGLSPGQREVWLTRWVEEAPNYQKLADTKNPLKTQGDVVWKVPDDPSPAHRTPWRELLAGMRQDINAIKGDDKLVKEGLADEEKLARELQELKDLKPLVKDREVVAARLQKFIKDATDARVNVLADVPLLVRQWEDDRRREIASLTGSDPIQATLMRELDVVVNKHADWRLGRRKERVKSVRAYLGELPSERQLAIANEATTRPWVQALVEVARAHHTKVVDEATRAPLLDDNAALESLGRTTRKAFDDWWARVDGLAKATLALEKHLDEYPAQPEAAGDPAGVGKLREAISQVSVDEEVSKTIKGVIARADALLAALAKSPDELRGIIAEGKLSDLSSHLDAQLAAWQLSARDIPLAAADAARRSLLSRLKAEAPGNAGAARMAERVAAIWLALAKPQIAAPPEGIEEDVLKTADALTEPASDASIRLSDLDPAGVYNLTVYRLLYAGKSTPEDQLRTAVAEARKVAATVLGGSASSRARDRSAVGTFLARLEAAQPELKATIDKVGPAAILNPSKGWSLTGPGDTYTKEGGLSIEFVYLEDTNSYLAKTEVPVELFASVIERSSEWEKLIDPKGGPQVWIKKGNKLGMAEDWFPTPPADENGNVPPPYVAAAGDWSPQPNRQRKPRYPMQRMAPETASWFAKQLGCRLPTRDEWKAALKEELKLNPHGKWNIRDSASWSAHLGKVLPTLEGYPATWRVIGDLEKKRWHAEDTWSTQPDGTLPLSGKGVNPNSDDGHLFLQPVDLSGEPNKQWEDVGRGKLFHHLIGNVAEYVVDSEGAETPTYAIGGSALSPPVAVDEAVPVPAGNKSRVGYTDVGLRLAFTRPVKPLFARLREAFEKKERVYLTNPLAPAPFR